MSDNENWPGRTAARQFTLWMILWVLIDLVILTWIFYAFGEEANFTGGSVSTIASGEAPVCEGREACGGSGNRQY